MVSKFPTILLLCILLNPCDSQGGDHDNSKKSHSLLTLQTQWPTSTLGEINHPLAVLLMTQPESTYFTAEDERDK